MDLHLSGMVLMGPGGSMMMQEGVVWFLNCMGGSRRVFEGLEVLEGPGGSGRVWKCMEGSRRV